MCGFVICPSTMTVIFCLLIFASFPMILVRTENQSVSTEETEKAHEEYVQSSLLITENVTTGSVGYTALQISTLNQATTQSAKTPVSQTETNQTADFGLNDTESDRSFDGSPGHTKRNQSFGDAGSSREKNPGAGASVVNASDGQPRSESPPRTANNLSVDIGLEYTQSYENAGVSLSRMGTNQSADNSLDNINRNDGSGDALGQAETDAGSESTIPVEWVQRNTNVDVLTNHSEQYAGLFSTYTESYENANVLTDQTESYQHSDTLIGDIQIGQTTGIHLVHMEKSQHKDVITNPTQTKETLPTLGPYETFYSKVPEIMTTSKDILTTRVPISKVFSTKKKRQGHYVTTVNIGACSHQIYYTFSMRTSYIRTLKLRIYPSQIDKPVIECGLTTNVEEGYYINLTVKEIKHKFDGNFSLTLSEVGSKDEVPGPVILDTAMLKNTTISFLSFNPVKFHFKSYAPYHPLTVTLRYLRQKGPFMRDLPIYKLSSAVSYVTSPGFIEHQQYPNYYDGEFLLNISNSEVLLTSFSQIYIDYSLDCLHDYLHIIELPGNETDTLCGSPVTYVKVFYRPVRLHFHTDNVYRQLGFKMMFSILPRTEEPKRLYSGIFDCAVPHFHRFKPLLNCNLLRECEGGEDEKDCWYHSNDCKRDAIDLGTKCYRLVRPRQSLTWFEAQKDCARYGMNLARFENIEEKEQYTRLQYLAKNLRYPYFGLQTISRLNAASVVMMYKNIWQWVNGRTAFSMHLNGHQHPPTCTYYNFLLDSFRPLPCNRKRTRIYVCDIAKQRTVLNMKSVAGLAENILNKTERVIWKLSVVQCPLGYVTRDFLACDSKTECIAPDSQMLCTTDAIEVEMFVCEQSRAVLHYTLVCDHMQHCSDNSDEDFCSHPPCPFDFGLFTCQNGQCISYHQLCDDKLDCYDGSDETCQLPDEYTPNITLPPGSVFFDGKGSHWVEAKELDYCPPTHFLCPRDFCLPVYLRCNGIQDCPGREDEAGCDSYTCPGFYRCRGSKVCLHADNVCDDVPQCPEQDDELLCDLSCPDQCHCQGLAFVCSTSFSASSYPALRYLDASGSGMTPGDFTDNMYLIHLRLSNCGIVTIYLNLSLPNLRVFDLSWNKQIHLDMSSFYPLANLRTFIIKGNPIVKMMDSSLLVSGHTKLKSIDLSHTSLEDFNGRVFKNMPDVTVLNMSFSRVRTISNEGLKFTPKLQYFDVRGSPLQIFPSELLVDLQYLKFVRTDNFKLCCEAMLPAKFNLKNCHSSQDFLASCTDLLRSNIYRVFLWTFASLSLVGNMGSFIARMHLNTEGKAVCCFSMFVTNLCIADFLMGVYLSIIGAADLNYLGEYVLHDTDWKNSTACKVAGFLSFLSSEVSAFMICVITLDRFLVLRFPFSKLRFGRTSALVVCGFVWLVGISLAMVPLLPMMSHWEFYSQTGICIPLPLNSSDGFRGYNYSFSVMLLLNLVLFVFIAVGQALVYWSIRMNSMSSAAKTKSRDATISRRLTTIVVSDFLCWFPIGLLGVMSATGTPIPGEVNVALSIMVLPFNSALNPFIYTFNVLMEKRKKAREASLIKHLECLIQTETNDKNE